MGDITELLQRVRDGDDGAFDRLFSTLYPQLRRMAHARLAKGGRHTLLDTTVLLHECYLKLSESGRLTLNDRGHFLAYASQAMRSIIVDYARWRGRERRGGDAAHESLDTELAEALPADAGEEILRVHEALEQLARRDERLAKVVEMRYFGGLSELEIAEAMGVTDRTVRRDWEKARLLLADALKV